MVDTPETLIDAPVAQLGAAVAPAPKVLKRKPAAVAKVAGPKIAAKAASPKVAAPKTAAPALAAPVAAPSPKAARPARTPKVAKPVKVVKAAKTATKPDPKAPAAPKTAKPKETIMTTAIDFTEAFKTAFADLQEKAKTAYEKSTSSMGEMTEFAKGNVEAIVESGKILSSGMQEMGSGLVAESRTAFETLTAEVKEMAAAKSPTDFFKLQSDLMRKQFDTVVAMSSKHSEAFLKLASEAAAPVSGRVSLAVDKIKAAA